MSDNLAIIFEQITSPLGTALANVNVAVLQGDLNGDNPVDTTVRPGSPLASLFYDPNGQTPMDNPTTTDGVGNLSTCLAAGYYVLQIYGVGIDGQQLIPLSVGTGGGGGDTLASLTDVSLTSLTVNQLLTWNGTKWTNEFLTMPLIFSSGVIGGQLLNPETSAVLAIDSTDYVSNGWYLQADTGNINIQGGASLGGIVLTAAGGNSVTIAGGPLHAPITINTQTASYQAVLEDADQLISMNIAGPSNFTIPAHATIAFTVGTRLSVLQQGAGQVTLVAAFGVTLHNPSSNTTRAQWSTVTVTQIATDLWVASGDLT